MKFFIITLLIVLLSFFSGCYFPWWGFAPMALLVSALLPQRPWPSFLAGFLALFLLWGGMAWGIDMANNSILSGKIAQILPLGGSSILLILVTALVGGLVGGGSSLAGSFLTTRKTGVAERIATDLNSAFPEEPPVAGR